MRRSVRLGVWVVGLAAAAGPRVALASVRHAAWTYGVDVGDEGESGAELWLGQNVGALQGHSLATQSYNLWTGLTTTLTDRLEVAVYGVMAEGTGDSPLHLERAEAQLRLKILDDLGVLAAPVLDTAGDAFGGLALLTLQHRAGPVDLTANLGGGYAYDFAPSSGGEVQLAAGASLPVGGPVRVNLEAFTHGTPRTDVWVAYAGPGVELDQGHFWGVLNVALGSDHGTLGSCTRLAMGLVF